MTLMLVLPIWFLIITRNREYKLIGFKTVPKNALKGVRINSYFMYLLTKLLVV